MSRYDWERGTLLLPSAAVTPLRKALLTTANDRRAACLTVASTLYEAVQRAAKGKRGFDQRKALLGEWNDTLMDIDGLATSLRLTWQERETLRTAFGQRDDTLGRYHERWAIVEALFPRAAGPKTNKAVRPLKKQFAPLPATTTAFRAGEASIHVDVTRRTVLYDSGHNNHAVEAAREEPLIAAFFHALDRIVWTRGTGGELVGNDEYNRETDYAGGGGNYVTERYGPLGGKKAGESAKQARDREAREAYARSRYSYAPAYARG